jgi:hypothetical protein
MSELDKGELPSHFKGKDVIGHVAEAQAQGIIYANEIHGTDTPGRTAAAADAARDTALMLTLLWQGLTLIGLPIPQIGSLMAAVGIALILWRSGRSGWLGWSRLERLHRVLEQEKWEIDHHRQQERDELRVLYAAKGFEGKLLEDVLDVLMADGDRLLKVMVQEELGLSLQAYDHPLMQASGAGAGVLVALLACCVGLFFSEIWGVFLAALTVIAAAGAFSAHSAGNRLIAAVVWNVALAVVAVGTLRFFLQYFLPPQIA